MSDYDTPQSFQLRVVGTTGITYKIYFENIDNVTVEELKNKISEKMSIPSYLFLLTFNGKFLDSEKKLSDYLITNESTINCVENTIGGKFKN